MIERIYGSRRSARLLSSAAALAACISWPGAAMASPPGRAAPAASPRCPAPTSWRAIRAAGVRPVVNLIQLDRAGQLYWNGAPIKETMLRQFMTITAAMTPRPQAHLEVDPATPCADVARIVALIAGAVDCRRGCSYRVGPWSPVRPVPPPAPPAPPLPPRRR